MSIWSRITSPLRQKSTAYMTVPSRAGTWNWWQFAGQRGRRDFANFAPVFACWRIISEEVARVPLRVIRETEDGRRTVIKTKAPTRVFRRPNSYQTASDLKLHITQSLLQDGNAYCYALRNERGEVAELHPVRPRNCEPYITDEGSVYYHVADSEALSLGKVEAGWWFPQRDVLHIRLFTYDHPLKGVSPLEAAALGINAGMNINMQTAAFFGNMGRPSGIIKHQKKLEPDEIKRVKERFVQATTGENAGAPVVLHNGLDWQQMSMSAVDAELIKSYNLTERQVAQVYRVPFFFLNEDADMKFSSVESLTRSFINSGLGFYFSHIAEALTQFFSLDPTEHVEFDYETALLQGDFDARMNAYKTAVQGGIYAVNEARGREGLPAVEHGDEVRMQQQMVPLSYGTNLQPPNAGEEFDPEPVEEADPGDLRAQKLRLKHELRLRLAA